MATKATNVNHEQWREENIALKAEFESLKAEVARLRRDHKDAQKIIDKDNEAEQRCHELDKKITEMRVTAKSMEQELIANRQQMAKMQEAFQKAGVGKTEELKSMFEELKSTLSEVRAKEVSIGVRNRELISFHRELTAKMDKLDKKFNNLSEESWSLLEMITGEKDDANGVSNDIRHW